MTAAQLLAALAPFGPSVEDDELVMDSDPPPELLSKLSVLHTGVRAVLCKRVWYGSSTADGTRPVVLEWNPAAPIPPRVWLLSVQGDVLWDRIAPDARIDAPELFGAAAVRTR